MIRALARPRAYMWNTPLGMKSIKSRVATQRTCECQRPHIKSNGGLSHSNLLSHEDLIYSFYFNFINVCPCYLKLIHK